jgi:hypothetical protein
MNTTFCPKLSATLIIALQLFVLSATASATAYAQQPSPSPVAPAAPGASNALAPAQPNSSVMCGGPVIFADDFKKMDRAWGRRDAAAFVTPNHAFGLAATTDHLNVRLYSGSRFGDGDICVNAFVSQSHSPGDYGGLVFWAQDSQNYYFLEFNEGGRYAVQRIRNGKSMPLLVAPTGVALPIKKGTNVANALEVSLSGSMAAIVVNGIAVGRFTGEPPAGGGYIGLAAGATKSGATSWGFFHLVVSAVMSVSPSRYLTPVYMTAANETMPSPCVGELLLYDDFKTLNNGWQPVDATVKVGDGLLTLSAPAREMNGRFFVDGNYSDFNECALVGTYTSGAAGGVGLMFWATDASNFYFFAVLGENTYGIFRYVNSRASTLVPWTPTNILNAGTNMWNELAVSARGSAISVAINGKVLTTVQGAPPNGGGRIGFLVDAPQSNPTAWSFGELRVTAPTVESADHSVTPPPLPSSTSIPPTATPVTPTGASDNAGAMPPL